MTAPSHFLVVLIGAAEFQPGFAPNLALERSRGAFKSYVEEVLQVPSANILDLFNSEKMVDVQDIEIAEFLKNHQKNLREGHPKFTLLLHYVGHGEFWHQDYYLILRQTRQDGLGVSGYGAKSLADTLRREARWMRTYALIDACFSGEVMKHFLGDSKVIFQPLVHSGVSLMCSSPSNQLSLLLPDESGTAFTDGLVTALRHGYEGGNKHLTFRQLHSITSIKINERRAHYKSALSAKMTNDYDPPAPQIFTPETEASDISLFPNPAWRPNDSGDFKKLSVNWRRTGATAKDKDGGDGLSQAPDSNRVSYQRDRRWRGVWKASAAGLATLAAAIYVWVAFRHGTPSNSGPTLPSHKESLNSGSTVSIGGRVRDAKTEMPVSGARVIILNIDAENGRAPFAITDGNGGYRFKALTPIRSQWIRVLIEKDGYEQSETEQYVDTFEHTIDIIPK